MRPRTHSKSSRDEVRAHRKRLRQQGLRPIQIWVPDMRSPDFCDRSTSPVPSCCQQSSREGGSGLHRRCLCLGRDVKRGEVWTVSGGKDYAGKPRPVVILQDDRFDMTDSITVYAFTTDPTDAPLLRLPVEPNESNALRAVCRLMVD